MAKPQGGLTKWFKAEKRSAAARKTGPSRVEYAVTASGRRRKKKK
jgi:hypothetical protein